MSLLPETSTGPLAFASVQLGRSERERGRRLKGTLARLYVNSAGIRAGSPGAYVLATLAVVIAVGLRLAFPYWLGAIPFSLLYLAVMAATFVCGAAAGAYSVGLAALVAWFVFISPQFPFEIHNAPDVSRLIGFVVVGAIQMLAVAAMRAAILRLRDLNSTLAAFFDANPDAILVVDPSHRIINANDRAAELFGYSRASLISQAIEALVPEGFDDSHVVRAAGSMTDAQSRGIRKGFELVARRHDGTEFPADVRIGPVRHDREPSIIAIVRDITEQKAVAAELLEARQQQAIREFGAILESFLDAIIGKDMDGIVTSWNRAAEAIFGYSRDEIVGRPISILFPADRLHEENEILDGIRGGQRVEHFETVRLHKDGREIAVSVTISPIFNPAGEIVGASKIARDITSQRRTEAQLVQAQKMEAIGNLTGGMAHDFNNLLGIIIGNLDLLRDRPGGDPDADELRGEALDAALRGADLTRRLLAFARRQPLQPERTDVNELIAGIVKLLERTLGEQIQITLDLNPDAWSVVVDPAQLESGLTNLATNARDAMPGGGQLTIVTGNRALDVDYAAQHAEVQPGDYAMIEVGDTGSGMPPEVASRIFEPFYTTKELGKGTGLGLSMVFGFIKQSGGHINVYSEVGIGTIFRLYLPRAKFGAQAGAVTASAELVRGGGETVLAVEDNASLRRVAVRQLTELGYRVLEAEDAQTALGILESEPIDLLFTDIVMPGGTSGYELARTVLSRWPAIKIVLTSGFPENRTNGDANVPNLRLLSKPYRGDELGCIIREILDS